MKKGVIYILGTAFFFGTLEVSLKSANLGMPAMQVTFLRFLICGLVLLPAAITSIRKRKVRLTKGDLAYLTLLGFICITCSMTVYQVGLNYCNANTAATILCINPAFTMVFAHFLTEDKFNRKKMVVLGLSIAGLVFVANPVNMAEGNTPLGILLVLFGAIAFGLFTALGKRRVGRIGSMAQNSFGFLLGCVIQLFILLFAKVPVFEGVTLANLPWILYLGVVVTGFGYICLVKGIETAGPSQASVAFFLKPIVSLIAAALFLGEAVTWNIVVGIAFISGGFLYSYKK